MIEVLPAASHSNWYLISPRQAENRGLPNAQLHNRNHCALPICRWKIENPNPSCPLEGSQQGTGPIRAPSHKSLRICSRLVMCGARYLFSAMISYSRGSMGRNSRSFHPPPLASPSELSRSSSAEVPRPPRRLSSSSSDSVLLTLSAMLRSTRIALSGIPPACGGALGLRSSRIVSVSS
ncbi:hypothetical protein VTK73DRAFT_3215 [Phialemonium thermophilum]|uniref:Uncharacterized protein n=1 Tax=Phialemonium thermophilum TaxID=223376 RepID=A0ABR3VJN4_9PEZI